MSSAPKVFIAYSHDSDEHKARVLEFSNLLRAKGFDSILDQYEVSPSSGWPVWMLKHIRRSDYILLVCTADYSSRIERMIDSQAGGRADSGYGVPWEIYLIYQEIYLNQMRNGRIIPVLFEGGHPKHIPAPLTSYSWHQVHYLDGDRDRFTMDKLCEHLRGRPEAERPPIGLDADRPAATALECRKARFNESLPRPGRIHVLLCYGPSEAKVARQVAEHLSGRDRVVFLAPWESESELGRAQALDRNHVLAGAAVILVGRHGFGPFSSPRGVIWINRILSDGARKVYAWRTNRSSVPAHLAGFDEFHLGVRCTKERLNQLAERVDSRPSPPIAPDFRTNTQLMLLDVVEDDRFLLYPAEAPPRVLDWNLPNPGQDVRGSISAWKKLHSLTEQTFYPHYWEFRLLMERVVTADPSGKDAYLNEAQQFFSKSLMPHFRRFASDLKSVDESLRETQMVRQLIEIENCLLPLKRCLFSSGESQDRANGLKLIERIGDWLAWALHYADMVIDKNLARAEGPR